MLNLYMKKIILGLSVVLIIIIFPLFFHSCNSRNDKGTKAVIDTISPLGFRLNGLDITDGEVESGTNFTTLLTDLGLSSEDAAKIVAKCDTIFDVRSLRAGNKWQAYYSGDSLKYVVYEEDIVNTTVFKCSDPIKVWRVSKPVKTQRTYSDVDIESSLWNDMQEAGASPLLILDLANIYAWSVDFFELQEGDRFRVLYSQTVCDDAIISIDTVFFAICTHNGKDYSAIRFDQNDKGNVYWNEKGESLKKAFLKAPLKFSRISSKFSYARRHPVTGKVRPHTGVDYAAPKGTPVMAIGDGRVLKAGWGGGGGNEVKIKHNGTYTSAYLHLSRYGKGVKTGARVHQGQVIGYVGSTGMSTGPHLDFRIWKNGRPVNPVGLISPPAAPIRSQYRAAFDSVSTSYKNVVDSLAIKIRSNRRVLK